MDAVSHSPIFTTIHRTLTSTAWAFSKLRYFLSLTIDLSLNERNGKSNSRNAGELASHAASSWCQAQFRQSSSVTETGAHRIELDLPVFDDPDGSDTYVRQDSTYEGCWLGRLYLL